MIRIGDNLIIDKLDCVDVHSMLKEQKHEFYEDGTIYKVNVIYDFISNWSHDIKIERFIHIMTEKSLVKYYVENIYTDDMAQCIVVYTDDGCGIFSDKVKDIYNLYLMSYSHDDASDSLSQEEIEQLKKQLDNKNSQ